MPERTKTPLAHKKYKLPDEELPTNRDWDAALDDILWDVADLKKHCLDIIARLKDLKNRSEFAVRAERVDKTPAVVAKAWLERKAQEKTLADRKHALSAEERTGENSAVVQGREAKCKKA